MSRIEPYPPANTDAEAAVLGAIFIDPDAKAAVAAILTPDDFYRETCRWVYQAMLDLGDTPADAVTVADLLDKRGQLDQAGWGIINELIAKAPSSLYAEHYARIVAGDARCRRWIAGSSRIASAAYRDGGQDPAEVARELLLHDRRPGGWQWRTLQAAYRPRPPRQYLAGGLLPLPSLAVLFGPPGSLNNRASVVYQSPPVIGGTGKQGTGDTVVLHFSTTPALRRNPYRRTHAPSALRLTTYLTADSFQLSAVR
jgi:hypothetical protein